MFRFHHVVFYSQLKSKLDNIHVKTGGLCINLSNDPRPIRFEYIMYFLDWYLQPHVMTQCVYITSISSDCPQDPTDFGKQYYHHY